MASRPSNVDRKQETGVDDDETERLMHCLTCPVMRFHYTALNAAWWSWRLKLAMRLELGWRGMAEGPARPCGDAGVWAPPPLSRDRKLIVETP